MKLCIVGTGYVGLVTGTCFADVGNDVICVDKDIGKIDLLRSGKSPIFETDLEPMIVRNMKEGRLRFTSDLKTGLADAHVCFICVDTPPGPDGTANIDNVISVAEDIGRLMDKDLVIASKSTVSVGTTFKIKDIVARELMLRNKPSIWVSVASNPEFLKEGSAVLDFLKPDRIVVGVETDAVGTVLNELYMPFITEKGRFIQMDVTSSELTKYASNCILATKISFMNELARFAEKVGADVRKIKEGMGYDPRIGPDFLYAGLGYGGSCFPKDISALIQMGKEYKTRLSIIEAASDANEIQKEWFWQKIEKYFGKTLSGRNITIWGGAFKPNTNDIRFAPALFIIDKLLANGANVSLFDPVAMDNIRGVYDKKVHFYDDAYECLNGADALVIVTEWNEFRSPNFERVKKMMKSPVIFDGRNIYNETVLMQKEFKYFGVGFKGVAE